MLAGFVVLVRRSMVGMIAAVIIHSGIAGAEESIPPGKQIADFQLQDYLGTKHSLTDWHEKKAVVVAFLGAECPMARLYAPRLAELADRYQSKGVQFVAIDANQQDGLAKIGAIRRTSKIEFPVLKDLGNKVADQFGAMRTPEVFVLDQKRTVRYCGRDRRSIRRRFHPRQSFARISRCRPAIVCWPANRFALRPRRPSAALSAK